MGWAARNKGTYDERKAKAIEKNKSSRQRAEEKERERLAALSPEEKRQRVKALNTMLLFSMFRGGL